MINVTKYANRASQVQTTLLDVVNGNTFTMWQS